MIVNSTLEFFNGLERQMTTAGVLESMKKALSDVGIDLFCLNVFHSPGQAFDAVLLASRMPAPWMELYTRKNYVAHDPSQRFGKRTVNPYEWKDAPYDPEREPKALEVVQRAKDFNIGNGFVVPVPGTHGCIGHVWMGGHNLQLTKRDMPTLHLMALYSFGRVQQLRGHDMPKPTLSGRQREILTWTAAGKTAWEIGEILSISHRTVEFHLQAAAQKLGTLNKMQTVTAALREHLIAA
jgi:LuxR family quorum sensing-dependent transcriptional regulator